MLLIPAIDLQKGRCVRLRQGDLENNITVYNEDAVDQACQWADLGAERIHIVDLDGAKTGKPVNAPLIREMIEEIGEDAEIEVGGGIRTLDQIEAYLDAGVRYAVIGTAAVKTPGFLKEACAVFTDSIIVALDAKDGIVALNGMVRTAYAAGCVEKAVPYLQAAIEADMQAEAMRVTLAGCFISLDRKDEARELLQKVLTDNPENESARSLLETLSA